MSGVAKTGCCDTDLSNPYLSTKPTRDHVSSNFG